MSNVVPLSRSDGTPALDCVEPGAVFRLREPYLAAYARNNSRMGHRVLVLPNGQVYRVHCTKMHREYWHGPDRRGTYKRVTDWIASAGDKIAWGTTRREAVAHLRLAWGLTP